MGTKVVSVLAGILAVILIYAGVKKPAMEVAREITIKATPEKLFPYINNSQKSNEWMPWVESDPGVKMNYSGPTEGLGAMSSWDSPGKMGTGTAEVVVSIPNKLVQTKLTYTKPMNMSQMAVITLTGSPSGETLVRWSVNGHNSYFFRLIGIFCNMDKMIGGEFEKGLLKLKKIAEAQ